MKYVQNLEVKDAVNEDSDDDIKELTYQFNITKAENNGAHIDEVADEMKRLFIEFLENN